MSVLINASTTTGTVISSDLSGNIKLQYNGVDAPAFSAYQSTLQSIPNLTYTKLQFQTKEFDTGNYFDSITNYRFTPLVGGYYQVSGAWWAAASTGAITTVAVYKNGSAYKNSGIFGVGGGAAVSCLVLLNGSTDYIELFASQNSGGAVNTVAISNQTYFQGILVRGT